MYRLKYHTHSLTAKRRLSYIGPTGHRPTESPRGYFHRSPGRISGGVPLTYHVVPVAYHDVLVGTGPTGLVSHYLPQCIPYTSRHNSETGASHALQTHQCIPCTLSLHPCIPCTYTYKNYYAACASHALTYIKITMPL